MQCHAVLTVPRTDTRKYHATIAALSRLLSPSHAAPTSFPCHHIWRDGLGSTLEDHSVQLLHHHTSSSSILSWYYTPASVTCHRLRVGLLCVLLIFSIRFVSYSRMCTLHGVRCTCADQAQQSRGAPAQERPRPPQHPLPHAWGVRQKAQWSSQHHRLLRCRRRQC